MEDARHDIDRSAAKKYFRGAGIWSKVLMVVGFFTMQIGIGFILILVSVIWIVACKLSAEAYEKKVDEILRSEQEYLLQRGMKQLCVVEQQVGLIEPINTVGMSYQPFEVSVGMGWIATIKYYVSIITGKIPYLMARISKEKIWRFSLNQINILIFGETQLFIYFAHVDITTGLIFHEGTHEYFYKDICGITIEQKLERKYNIKKRKWESKVLNFLNIFTSGCSHSVGFNQLGDVSNVDKQLTAMRNLIREKKEE